jgi:Kef-type K+ transport system membrane component KefB
VTLHHHTAARRNLALNTMSLIQNLCLLLIAAHLLGKLASRLGQPELLGHMMAGVLLGPALFNWVSANSQLNSFADLAVLWVVISAGLEMRLRDVTAMFRGRGVLALLPGIILPAAAGLALALYFAQPGLSAIVVALCVSVTALPVALRILASFGLIGTRLAQLTIAGALLADVLVLLSLGVLSANANGSPNSTGSLLGLGLLKLLALMALVAIGAMLCKRIYRQRALQPRRLAAAQLSFALLLILGLAAASDALGLHFAIGAFLGALTVSEFHTEGTHGSAAQHPLRTQLEGMSNILFAPLFLACQGTHFTASSFTHPAFAISLVLVAIATKMIGGYWGARIAGLSRHESQGTAIVMNARGVMEMVVASIAYRAGLVDQSLFSTLLIVGIVTTLVTPLLLKRWQRLGELPITAKKTADM